MIKLFYMRFKLYRLYKKHNKLYDIALEHKIKSLEHDIFVAEREHYYKQTCFAWCSCGHELTFCDKSFIEDTDTVKYKCIKCGRESEWDFDAPAPILLDIK